MKESEAKPHRYGAELANAIEERWQAWWSEHDTFRVPNPGEPGFDPKKPAFYVLDMFPYPSGAGLHVGHPEGYTATDIVARYRRMRGYSVLHPMGWDAFGLPAEQYAIQTGIHPAVTTRKSIDTFRRQLQRFGFCYDWSREFGTIDPDYYRWTQWIFLRIYDSWYDPDAHRARPIAELIAELESGARVARINPDAAEHSSDAKDAPLGKWAELDDADKRRIVDSYRLAYVAEQTVNWCPKLGTALANEEVIDGRSERGGFPVFRKPLRQWLFRITAYSERLLDGLADLDWPESTKIKQTDWIGRSEGAEIDFALAAPIAGIERLRVYTTRPDTLFGATYMVVAPEHPLVDAVIAEPLDETAVDSVRAYAIEARNRSDLERQQSKDKTGVFTGAHAINPATGERIPIWVADYVLMGYGHGAIMAVPAHDERDWEFAEKFGLPIVQVVEPSDGGKLEECFADPGRAINCANAEISLDGLSTKEAKTQITNWLAEKGLGRRRINYKLRDWLFSRQRYWGEPFPLVYDEHGHHHRVADEALPVVLPELESYAPEESDEPKPLLAKAERWVHTTAGEAGVTSLPKDAKVIRETNTMPGWAGSCWYHLRYCDPKNQERIASEEAEGYWIGERGVDLYVGGSEHAVLHLLYARFWHKVLHDLGHVKSDEPYRKLFHQGLIVSYAYQRPDKSLVPIDQVDEVSAGKFVERATGAEVAQVMAKMSKSLKNVVNPDDVIASYGADTFRLYEMYMGPLEVSKPWNTQDIMGMHRFLQRVWRLFVDERDGTLTLAEEPNDDIEKQLHRTIEAVGRGIDTLAFNTAIARMVEMVNAATAADGMTRDQASRFVRILHPFAPHLTEELWHRLSEQPSLIDQPWPSYDEAMLRDDEIEIPVQVRGKVRSKIRVAADAEVEAIEKIALADPKVKEHLGDKPPKKVIVVPGRMVNVVPG